jgi:hypothetical protein
MKNFLKSMLLLLLLSIPIASFAQTGPPAPGTGVYALIDTNYTVGTNTQGNSVAKLTYKNNTSTLVTGLQFRVFYDNAAFASSTVSLIGTTTNLDLQYVDSPTNGYVTITLVYTGSSSTYTLPEGETFQLTFTHVNATSFYALNAIQNLTWTGAQTFPQLAAEQSGSDTALTLHNYGGTWLMPQLTYSGSFVNVTGTPAKNLPLSLEKKVKIGGTWGTHASYTTDINGDFTFTETIDTTYYDVRLAIVGDTMSVGNVISTADAQLINQWVLGTATPSGFDFYTGDVNGSNNLSVTDAYGVFGRIAGRFTVWPNNVKEVKFFTAAEYATITGTPSTNYTSSIPGVTNFYFDILPGQPDSVTFYVAVPGDANGTGYQMARMTPIMTSIVPSPGSPLATENVIDMKVEYDFLTENIELNVPHISVNEGNLVELPVTLKTNNKMISSLQFSLLYDENLLDFRDITNSEKSMFWLSAVNPTGGIVEWAGYDPSATRQYSMPDNYTAFTLRFIAKQPQSTWTQSPLYTTHKFSGDMVSKDLSITPTNGILVVYKMSSGGLTTTEKMIVWPNPTSGDLNIDFTVENSGRVKLYMMDLNGNLLHVILDKDMPAGKYLYNTNLTNLSTGLYIATLQNIGAPASSAKIIKK